MQNTLNVEDLQALKRISEILEKRLNTASQLTYSSDASNVEDLKTIMTYFEFNQMSVGDFSNFLNYIQIISEFYQCGSKVSETVQILEIKNVLGVLQKIPPNTVKH